MESASSSSGIEPEEKFNMGMKQLRKQSLFPNLNIIKLK